MTECVLLAAGRGERFAAGAASAASAAGEPDAVLKPLASFQGEPLILHGLRNALAACDRCVVVTGFGAERITPVVAGIDRVTVVHNEYFDRGMVWSIACGLAVVEQPLVFIAPADMPALHPEIYRTLEGVARAEHSSPPAAFMPVFQGRQGHPVLLQTAVREELQRALASAFPPDSMRAFLQRYPVQEVPVRTDAILWDIDTPEELARGER